MKYDIKLTIRRCTEKMPNAKTLAKKQSDVEVLKEKLVNNILAILLGVVDMIDQTLICNIHHRLLTIYSCQP